MSIEQLRFLLKVVQVPFSMEVPIDREETSRLLGESIESNLPTPEDWIAQESMREEVENILSCLSPQEQDILRLRYGLGDGEIKTSEEVSQLLNLSRKEIHQIRLKAMNKLRRRFYGSGEEYL